MLFGKAVAYL